MNRFFTQYPWSATTLNERRLELLRQEPATSPKKPAVWIIDDTHNEKYGRHLPLLGKGFIPSADRYGLSHHVVTLPYTDRHIDYPLELRWYEPTRLAAAVRRLR